MVLIIISYHPLYYPVDTPIQYIFNVVQGLLVTLYHNCVIECEVLQVLRDSISYMGNFQNYYKHCDY